MNTNSTPQPRPIRRGGLSTARILCLALAATAALFNARTATAANIVWVTDANDPATGFFPPGSGFTDSGFVTLLLNAGHNVIRYNPPAAVATMLSSAELAALNTNDLVIISRCVNSAIFQTGQGNQWNTAITKPLMDLSAFHARNSRLGWFAGNEGPDNTPTPLSAVFTGEPARDAVIDYLFSGVAMNGTNSALPFDETVDRNSTPIPSLPVAGGIIYATGTYAQENSAAIPTMTNGNFIVGFPVNTAVRGGVDILGGYRMFFAAGSRESATAPNIIQFYTSRENLTPTGEGIFIRAVQVALNSGTAPATDPSAPPSVVSQPISAIVNQGGSATFSISVAGAAPRTVQWQRDTGDGVTFTNIPDASTPFLNSQLTLPVVGTEDNNAKFRVEVSNANGTLSSDVVTLTVTPDNAPPVPLSAASVDGLTIGVCFDEIVDPIAAEFAFSYALTTASGVGVRAATLQPDHRTVILTLDGPASATFTLNIIEVTDRFGNAIPSEGVNVSGVNLGFTATDVGALNPAGTDFSCDASSFVVGGGGLDIQATGEQMRLVYKSVSGDFDARVRVVSLLGTPDHLEATAKAMLCARASTDGAAPSVNAFVTPPYPADATYWATARTANGAPTSSNIVSVPYGLNAVPVSYPDAWLRLVRAGDAFTTYRSVNGTDWSPLGSINVVMGPDALVGVGVVSHRNGRLAYGTFSNFSITQSADRPTITGLTYTSGSFSGSFQTQSGFNYRVQYKDDLNAASWQTLTTIPGDGTVKSFSDPGPAGTQRFYQVIVP